MELVSLQPHMHLRGKGHDDSRDLSLRRNPKTLLSVPQRTISIGR